MSKRFNRSLNERLRAIIDAYTGTPFGEQLRKAYQGNASYAELCRMCRLDPAEYGIEEEKNVLRDTGRG